MNWFENPWDIGAPPPSGAKPTTSAPPNNTQLDTTQNSAATPSPEAEGSAGGESVNLGSMLMVLGLMQENAARIKELRQNRETALLQNAELLQTQLQRNYDLLQQQHSQQLDMMDMQMKLQQAQPVDWSVNRWDITQAQRVELVKPQQKKAGCTGYYSESGVFLEDALDGEMYIVLNNNISTTGKIKNKNNSVKLPPKPIRDLIEKSYNKVNMETPLQEQGGVWGTPTSQNKRPSEEEMEKMSIEELKEFSNDNNLKEDDKIGFAYATPELAQENVENSGRISLRNALVEDPIIIEKIGVNNVQNTYQVVQPIDEKIKPRTYEGENKKQKIYFMPMELADVLGTYHIHRKRKHILAGDKEQIADMTGDINDMKVNINKIPYGPTVPDDFNRAREYPNADYHYVFEPEENDGEGMVYIYNSRGASSKAITKISRNLFFQKCT